MATDIPIDPDPASQPPAITETEPEVVADGQPAARHPRRRRRILLIGGPVVLALLIVLAVTGAWYVTGRDDDGRVAGHVQVAGVDVGGMSRAELAAVVDRAATRLETTDVTVTTPKGSFTLHPRDIHLAVDRAALVDEALAAGRGGPGVLEPARWISRMIAPVRVGVPIDLDRDAVASLVATDDPTGRVEPVEPSVGEQAGVLAVTAGVAGTGVRGVDVADAITATGASGRAPIRVTVLPTTLAPRYTDADAQALRGRATALTASPARVTIAGVEKTVPVATLQRWLTTRPNAARTGLTLAFAADRVSADLVALVGDVGAPAAPASVAPQGDKLAVVAGSPGTRCCDGAAADTLFDALDHGAQQPVEVPLSPREGGPGKAAADLAALQSRGIKDKIGEFTTNYIAGQSRVVNIHRIADLIRGHVIEPGTSFSINNFVGPRTTQKGFTTGGVIEGLVFSESVGGGISQFATTIFNAAFFAGLDFDTYQSHTIYISRYPYGREATLSYPSPDLVIRNTTPYPVYIWTGYTATSITVSLWSTHYVSGAQTGQTRSPLGACTRVRTERTRTYVDGHKSVDSVFATYQPAEGKGC
ncbi:MAG TPA: VanW family protein [Acidimicrobiales bacterium]